VTDETEDRLFTVEEANALLPAIRRSLAAIRQARQVVLEGGERIRHTASLNGGGKDGSAYWEALGTLRREVESIVGQGIILRDPDAGLVDFPSRRDGQAVLLCWRADEDRVAWWHSPGSGFVGRRPL
jgi:hypothetical protein